MAQNEIAVNGRVNSAAAKVSGRFSREVTRSKGKIFTETKMGPDATSSLRFRGGREIAGFALNPCPGASLSGEMGEAAAQGLAIKLASATASGYFREVQRGIEKTDEVVYSHLRMSGDVSLNLQGVRGNGVLRFNPAPGVRMTIAVGR